MPKKIIRRWDHERTALLNQEDLSVERGVGSENYFYVWNRDYASGREKESCCCPFCGSVKVKNQGLFPKTYLDLIQDGERKRSVKLQYQFYKYICLECRRTFAPEITFASRNDRVTYRVEDEIVRLITEGCSYREISDRFQGAVTRQAVGQIFQRWVRKKEEQKKTERTPMKMAIKSGKLPSGFYTLFLNLDDGVRIYDFLFNKEGISSSEIASKIRSMDTDNIKLIVTDCDPIITDIVAEHIPGACHVILVEYWFDLIAKMFRKFANKELKWCQVPLKEDLVVKPPSEVIYQSDLEKILSARPGITGRYNAYQQLQEIVFQRDKTEIYEEIISWSESLNQEFASEISVAMVQFRAYQRQIKEYLCCYREIPETLYRSTTTLEMILTERKKKIFSGEVFKARLFYLMDRDSEEWHGVPVEEIIKSFNPGVRKMEE